MRNLLRACSVLVAATSVSHAAIDNGLLALVPSDTKIIASIDVQRETSSDFGRYILNKLHGEDQNFEEFAQRTGFDPRRDLQDLVFCTSASTNGDGPSRFAVLARGYFDQDRIEAAARSKRTTVQTYQGVKLYMSPANGQSTGFAFLDVGIAVLADRDTLRQIIDNRASSSTLDPALQTLISKVGVSNDAWFASLGPGPYIEGSGRRPAPAPAQALQSITQSTGGILFGSMVRLSIDATARSPKDALSLADVIRFAASMVQLQRQKDPRANIAASALDNMDLRTDTNKVHLTISVPEASLEQLADQAGTGYSFQSKPTRR